jgi:putative methionine-R-sulfoxide reductase with GAF domain
MSSTSERALERIEAVVARADDADTILRDVVEALHADMGYAWAGILFVEADELALGPEAGTPDASRRSTVAVSWNGARVAELAVDDAPEEDRMFLERVAELVADHCLVGWDTGGESWEP